MSPCGNLFPATALGSETSATSVRAYLIGLSTVQREPLLGHYDQGTLRLNDLGLVVADEWVQSARHRKGIELDLWQVTPSSLQGIVFLQSPAAPYPAIASSSSQKPWLLSSFIASFKAAAAKRINLKRDQLGQSVWQRNYNEQLITDSDHLAELRDRLSGTHL
ncbi:MAG TPA: hypothetical protein VLS96_08870 [Nodosilinea sp.]|nr:hypothetical protein [Nodosilinea sp.]